MKRKVGVVLLSMLSLWAVIDCVSPKLYPVEGVMIGQGSDRSNVATTQPGQEWQFYGRIEVRIDEARRLREGIPLGAMLPDYARVLRTKKEFTVRDIEGLELYGLDGKPLNMRLRDIASIEVSLTPMEGRRGIIALERRGPTDTLPDR